MDDLISSSIYEVQIKFKLLYVCSSFSEENRALVDNGRFIKVKLLLKILSLISLKEVLVGKFRHRLVINYFKKLACGVAESSVLESNILFLDSTYLSSVGVSSIYTDFM